MASRLFSLQGLVLSSVVESLLATKLAAEYLPQPNPFVYIFIRLLGLNFILWTTFWGLIYPYLLSPIRHFPEPNHFGARLAYFRFMIKTPPGRYFLEWSTVTPNDGILLLRSPFQTSRLLVTKPKALADLLVANAYDFVKPKRIRDFLRQVLGDGLIIVEGDVHRFQRKHTMPAFSFRNIKDLYPMMWRKAVTLTETITSELEQQMPQGPTGDEKVISGTTEINAWASKVTLDIIGVAGLGQEFNVLKNSDHQLVRDYEELLEPTVEKLFFFLASAYISPKYVRLLPWGLNEVFKRTTTSLANMCGQFVKNKRQAMKAGSDDHFDILSLLIKSNDFSDKELSDQLLTFLAAGHETTSSALTWATYLLAIHPEMQRRLREEVRQALPTNPVLDPNIDIAGILERLPLLNGVCNETLRLYPTVPVTIRIALRNTRLLDHPIPRGTEIILSPWAVNRSPELWGPTAGDFIPERWIDGDKPNNSGGADSNYSQLTFLHGPRSCIGQNFAKAELRCLVAAFICAFEWTLGMKNEDVEPAGVVTIKPKKGLHLRLKKISDW